MSVPYVRHFLVCGWIEYDYDKPVAPYSLHNVAFAYRTPAGSSFPTAMPEI